MSDNITSMEITGREAKLILKYGYPFPEQAVIFKAVSGKQGWHSIIIEEYWLELIIGDLGRSIREVKSHRLQEELDSLCCSLEVAARRSLIRVIS